jgi:hypothetical protein
MGIFVRLKLKGVLLLDNYHHRAEINGDIGPINVSREKETKWR